MADDQLRYLIEHAEDIVPVLYDHARKLAARKYGWREGKALPLGKSPEEIVTDAYIKYMEGKRKFDPAKDMLFQLKGTVRSLMWALCDKSSTKNELLAWSDEETDKAMELGSNDATPSESVESADFARKVVEAVNAHPRIKANQDLQDLIAAFDLDVTEVQGQADMLGKKNEQISQLRFQLRDITHGVWQEINMNQKTI
jgi:hypothetical protein